MFNLLKDLLLIDDLIPENIQEPFKRLATLPERYRNLAHHFAIKPICPGCILRTNMTVAWHSGICVADNRVIELQGSGIVERVTLRTFIQVPRITEPICEVLCDEYGVPCYHPMWAKRADLAEKKSINYGYFSNNCHRFTISCILGSDRNRLVAYSISDIEDAVKSILGLTHIEWRKLHQLP